MRLLIDIQGAQSASRLRGIGRYSLSLVTELVLQAQDDEVHLLVNGLLSETVEDIRCAFDPYLPQSRIHTWEGVGPVRFIDPGTADLRLAAELSREAFVASLAPDLVLLTSLFEGYGDDVVTSVGRTAGQPPCAIVIYDLIPYLYPQAYLAQPELARWYHQKLDHARRADLMLAISQATANDVAGHLGLGADQVCNISAACDARFSPQAVDGIERARLARRWGITRPYVLYVTGGDVRKNNAALIEAWAAVPRDQRDEHQLVLVSSTIIGGIVIELEACRDAAGLSRQDVLVINDCADDDLVLIYRACKLFVFASWYEGFGLPALEAMACGRAVIAADASSLPEVVGRADALFDPHDRAAMAAKITEVLGSATLLAKLEKHSLKRAASFSWASCAASAWRALRAHKQPRPASAPRASLSERPRLLYMPLTPGASQAAREVERAWVPELSRHFQLEFLQTSDESAAQWPFGRQRSLAWIGEHGHVFEHILYALGSGPRWPELEALMRQRPGIVLLFEPFWLASDASARAVPAFARALLAQGGWPALRESVRLQAETPTATVPIRPDWEALVNGRGLVVFDHASKDLAIAAFGQSFDSHVEVVPVPMPLRPGSRSHSRQLLALREHEVLVCVPAPLGTAQALTTLVRAWKRLQASPPSDARLVLLGSVGGADAAELQAELSGSGVIVAGLLSDTAAAIWLDAADLCVVLNPPEMPVFEQQHRLLGHMARDLAVAAECSAAVLSEVGAGRFDPTCESDVVRVLEPLCASAASRRVRMEATHQQLRNHHSRRGSADCLAASVLRLHAARGVDALQVAGEIAESCPDLASEQRTGIAAALVRNFPPLARRRQLLIDVSELARHDARSGIQRVVRAVLMELVSINPQDFDLQPICATDGVQGYRYARSFMSGFVGAKSDWTLDEPVEAWPGDVFFGLDFQSIISYVQRDVLRRWQRRGVRVQFLVYDLLPLLRPDCFSEGARSTHHRWLSLLSEFDGAICISRAVADEYLAWLDAFGSRRARPLAVNWAHLGADLAGSVPTTGVPPESAVLLEALRGRPSWLLVGTIEPRKGYRQVIDAFDALWRSGLDANLVIVGKLGWQMDDLALRMRQHDELGRRLFWLEAITDEYLDLVYANSSCLICASEGEGFGLPLIEAARHGMPLICRDIEVFREIAGNHATYFADTPDPAALVEVVRHWLAMYRAGTHPGSQGIRGLSWNDCASRLLEILRGDDAYRRWQPTAAQARWGNDPDATSEVGRPMKVAVNTTGRAGLLYAGAPLELSAGEYDLCMELAGADLTGDEWVEVLSVQGEERLLSLQLGAAGSSPGSFRARLRLDSKVPDLQVRLRVAEASRLSLSRVAVVPA